MATSMLAGVCWPFEIVPGVVLRVAAVSPQRHVVAALINLNVRPSTSSGC